MKWSASVRQPTTDLASVRQPTTDLSTNLPGASLLTRMREAVPEWQAATWGSIGVTSLFVSITCWWVLNDHTIPPFDAGLHLSLALNVHRELAAGHLAEAVKLSKPYPPFTYLVGALGITIAGASVAALVITENLVFVPLLALGCYGLGKRAFSPPAGFLAVVFALGSPLAIAQSHVFMTDLPETAMVAISLYLIVASECFSRLRVTALAGIAVGLGMLTKEPFVLFIAGPVAVTVVRIGIRIFRKERPEWRGLVMFILIAGAIGGPWYVAEYSVVQGLANGTALSRIGVEPRDIVPGRLTFDNFTWYFWNFINFQLWAPLFVFAAAGWLLMAIRLLRRRTASPLAAEMMVGSLLGWLGISETFPHDTRYSEPMLIYLALFGAGCITIMNRRLRLTASALLVLVAIVNTLGVSFGIGRNVALKTENTETLQYRGDVVVLGDGGFLVGQPRRDGDMQRLLEELHHHGVTEMALSHRFIFEPDFSAAGLTALGQMAGMRVVPQPRASNKVAQFIHQSIPPLGPVPCITLSDGTGVWVVLGAPRSFSEFDLYCPSRNPPFYPK